MTPKNPVNDLEKALKRFRNKEPEAGTLNKWADDMLAREKTKGNPKPVKANWPAWLPVLATAALTLFVVWSIKPGSNRDDFRFGAGHFMSDTDMNLQQARYVGKVGKQGILETGTGKDKKQIRVSIGDKLGGLKVLSVLADRIEFEDPRKERWTIKIKGDGLIRGDIPVKPNLDFSKDPWLRTNYIKPEFVKPFTVSGTVIGKDGKPANGVRLTFKPTSGPAQAVFFAETADNGTFFLGADQELACVLIEEGWGGMTHFLCGPWSKDSELNIDFREVLKKTFTLSGMVKSKDGNVAGLAVSATRFPSGISFVQSGRTDENGSFSLICHEPVALLKLHARQGTFKLDKGWDRDAQVIFDLDASSEFTLTGSVVDTKGNPLKNIFLQGSNEEYGHHPGAVTDEFGKFKMTANFPLKKIILSKPNECSMTIDGNWNRAEDIKLVFDESNNFTLNIQVKTPNGEQVALPALYGKDHNFTGNARYQSPNHYTYVGSEPAEKIVVRYENYLVEKIGPWDKNTNIVFEVPENKGLRGKVTLNGKAVSSGRVHAIGQDIEASVALDSKGCFAFRTNCVIDALSYRDGMILETLTGPFPKNGEVSFELKKPDCGILRGKFLDTSGNPIAMNLYDVSLKESEGIFLYDKKGLRIGYPLKTDNNGSFECVYPGSIGKIIAKKAPKIGGANDSLQVLAMLEGNWTGEANVEIDLRKQKLSRVIVSLKPGPKGLMPETGVSIRIFDKAGCQILLTWGLSKGRQLLLDTNIEIGSIEVSYGEQKAVYDKKISGSANIEIPFDYIKPEPLPNQNPTPKPAPKPKNTNHQGK